MRSDCRAFFPFPEELFYLRLSRFRTELVIVCSLASALHNLLIHENIRVIIGEFLEAPNKLCFSFIALNVLDCRF